MMYLVTKSTSINLRITPEFRHELQQLADFRGLSLSSLAHSLLVKAMRNEKQNEPEAFSKGRLEPAVTRKAENFDRKRKTG